MKKFAVDGGQSGPMQQVATDCHLEKHLHHLQSADNISTNEKKFKSKEKR